MCLNTSWIFNVGAEIYAWFTAQPIWRNSCAGLATHLPDRKGILVADVGCGPGVSTIELARVRPDGRFVGLDVSPRMLREARRRFKTAGVVPGGFGQIAWTLGDVAHLPFRAGALDAVTGHSFLYLLPDRLAALTEIHRVLRTGGRLILMEPNAQPVSLARALSLSHDPRHLVSVGLWRPFSRLHGRFSPESLVALLNQAGFVDCQAEETLGGLGVLARAEKPDGIP